MDLNLKLQVKLAPLNGVIPSTVKRSKDRNRLKGGCTNLMYACQQGLTDTIVKEVRLQVKSQNEEICKRKAFYNFKEQIFVCQLNFKCVNKFFIQEMGSW